MPIRTTIVGILGVLFMSACSGAIGVLPGDAVIPPEAGAVELSIVVLAADDLVQIDSLVVADGVSVPPDSEGTLVLVWESGPVELVVSAPGFEPWDVAVDQYPDGGTIEFRLEPVVLSGVVTTSDGRPLPGAAVVLGDSDDTTDNEGRFALERAVPGAIELSRPAWETVEYEWDGSADQYDMSMQPRIIRALRAGPDDVLEGERWAKILSLADSTAINGLVVDLKSEDGTVLYATDVEAAKAAGAVSSFFDPQTVVRDAKDHNLYLIGRIVVFQDDFYAAAEPSLAVVDESGALWRSRNGFAWLDPSDPASYEYSIAIAEEACALGFDEIQFDYVSYPFGGDVNTATFDGEYNQEVRVSSISAFLERAQAVLHLKNCALSSTLLGIVLESSSDEGVGQRPGSMSRIVDVLSPTLYSTNYGQGWKNFENPDDHAVEIVDTALAGGRGKLDGHAYLRPWLQTWAIDDVQQRAVQSVVTNQDMGWLLWSNSTNYSTGALPQR